MLKTGHFEDLDSLARRRGVGRSRLFLLVTSLSMSAMSFPAIAQESGAATDRAVVGVAPAKVARYVAVILQQHDRNGDGQLAEEEWKQMNGEPSAIDRNHDGVVTRSELQTHIMTYGRARAPVPIVQPIDGAFGGIEPDATNSVSTDEEPGSASGDVSTESGGGAKTEPRQRNTKYFVRPSRGLGKMPSWFLARDSDGDGQLTLREFSADSPGRSREFEKIDRNGDGVLTPREATAPRSEKQPSNP